MLSLPVYLRGGTFYFHTRINGQQVKRSLRTGDPLLAKLRAVQLLGVLDMHRPKVSDFDFTTPQEKYEIDFATGKLKADGPKDHARMLEALEKLTSWQKSSTPPAVAVAHTVATTTPIASGSRLTLSELAAKLFTLKSSPLLFLWLRNCSLQVALDSNSMEWIVRVKNIRGFPSLVR